MSDKHQENVSALVDDELDGHELQQTLQQLAQSVELKRQWSRYHLISDTLHANLSAADSTKLQDRVRQALENEPTILAPQRHKKVHPLIKQAAGLAIAASVAAVAILTVKDTELPGSDTLVTPQLAQTVPNEKAMVQLASTDVRSEKSGQVARDRLNPYLINHNEYSVSTGMHGVLPYARLVSNESAR